MFYPGVGVYGEVHRDAVVLLCDCQCRAPNVFYIWNNDLMHLHIANMLIIKQNNLINNLDKCIQLKKCIESMVSKKYGIATVVRNILKI